MKAIVYHNYGSPDVLTLQEVEKPALEDKHILVRVRAAAVNWLDWHFLEGSPLLVRLMAGLFKPKNKILGIDMAGQVEEVGLGVNIFNPGDQVYGSTSHGCFAEYVCVREDEVQIKPDQLTFEQAGAVGAAAVVALQGLRVFGQFEPGKKVLINGASGGVGTFAVQIAKSFGARVTGVCSSRNADLVKEIGADQVIDYIREDCIQSGAPYDLIFDCVAKLSFARCKPALSPQGIYVTTEFSPLLAIRGQLNSLFGSKKMVPLSPRPPNLQERIFIHELLESGNIKPVIDRCYPLSEVPDALRYLEQGHACGKVVITT